MKKVALAMALVLVHELPLAQGGNTSFGRPDCGHWLKSQRPGDRMWLLGYLSGLNTMWTAASKSNLDVLDALGSAEQAYAWMDNYCQKNPLENLGSGAVDLFIELRKTKASKP
jgi:hypothetical protein